MIKASKNDLTATIHKTGRICFSMRAVKEMNIDKYKSVFIYQDLDVPDSKDLFLFLNDNEEINSFEITRINDNRLIQATQIMHYFKYDFRNKNKLMKFKIEKVEYNLAEYFKFSCYEEEINNGTKV